MSEFPVLSGKEIVKRFETFGYRFVRQSGSHMRLIHSSDMTRKPLTIPNHPAVKKGILKKCLRDSKISLDEFLH